MTPDRCGRWYLLAFLLAASAHAALFTAIPSRRPAIALPDAGPPAVEVELVAAVPVEEPPPPPELPPEPTPPPAPPPEPEPTPVPVTEPAPLTTPPPAPLATPEPPRRAATPPPRPQPAARPKTAAVPRPATSAAAATAPRAPTGAVREARPDAPRNRPPAYPEIARRNAWQGRVIVRVTVSEAGRVTSVALQRGSGYGVLDQAALQAVRGWRFLPRTVGGQPVGATIDVPVTFHLRS